jgi:glycosyltransferase involved in cell wall biosynthesis
VEILVVDNNSNDYTKELIADYAKRSRIPLRYFFEAEQGLSAARNRAIQEAVGEYVGFVDDECVVRQEWLEIAVSDINEFAPFIIGGPYIGAMLPGIAPKWFKSEYGNAHFLARNFERGFQKEFRASGGNMFIHRRVFETQSFDTAFGVRGAELKLGEETLLQEKFLTENSGAMVFYEPRIDVIHYILPHKMRLSYWAKREMEYGAAGYRIGTSEKSFPFFKFARAIAYLCLAPLLAVSRDRRLYPYWQNYAFEEVIGRAMPVIGVALEVLRNRYYIVSSEGDDVAPLS